MDAIHLFHLTYSINLCQNKWDKHVILSYITRNHGNQHIIESGNNDNDQLQLVLCYGQWGAVFSRHLM